MRAKKCLSMLLVLVMMLSLFPMNAFALGGGAIKEYVERAEQEQA